MEDEVAAYTKNKQKLSKLLPELDEAMEEAFKWTCFVDETLRGKADHDIPSCKVLRLSAIRRWHELETEFSGNKSNLNLTE